MGKRIFILGVSVVVIFLSLPFFVDEEKVPSKPALLPQIYTANPLTPFMQHFRRFMKEMTNQFDKQEASAVQSGKNETAKAKSKANKKSLLSRASGRIKDAWKKTAAPAKQNKESQIALAQDGQAPSDSDLLALQNSGDYVLGQQHAPLVAAKGMHDIKTKEAYENYMRSSDYKPDDNEIFLPRSNKMAAVAGVSNFKQEGAAARRPLNNLFSASKGSNTGRISSRSTRSGASSPADIAQERAQAWKEIDDKIADTARLRASIKYPNPKTAKEREARDKMIQQEQANLIREINDAYIHDLFGQEQAQEQVAVAPAVTQPEINPEDAAKEDDIQSVIFSKLLKEDEKNPNKLPFSRVIDNPKEDFAKPETWVDSTKEDKGAKENKIRTLPQAMVLGPELDAKELAKFQDDPLRNMLTVAYDVIQEDMGCENGKVCLWQYERYNSLSGNNRSIDINLALFNAGYQVLSGEKQDTRRIELKIASRLLLYNNTSKLPQGKTTPDSKPDPNLKFYTSSEDYVHIHFKTTSALSNLSFSFADRENIDLNKMAEEKKTIICLDGRSCKPVLDDYVKSNAQNNGKTPVNLAETVIVLVDENGKLTKVSDLKNIQEATDRVNQSTQRSLNIADDIVSEENTNAIRDAIKTGLSVTNEAESHQ